MLVEDQELVRYSYTPQTALLKDIVYGNGHKIDYLYDAYDRVSEVSVGDTSQVTPAYRYAYDAGGNLGFHEDLIAR